MASRRRATRRLARIALVAFAAVAAAGVAVGAPTFRTHEVGLETRTTGGDVVIVNSKEGQAVHSLANMRPGTSATGSVVISNTGDAPGNLTLSKSNLVDTAGPNGGQLSGILDLTVTETTAAPTTVYTGKLPALGALALGTIYPGQARTFAFVTTFPDGGAPPSATGGDNAYQGSVTTAQYDWDATAAPEDTDPPDTTITAAPAAVTSDTTGSFSFAATEAGSTFECSLDGAAFSPCTSPRLYTGLAPGEHSFAVRARDTAGNVDPTPATYGWRIALPADTVPPQTTIFSAPPAATTATTARFEFASNEGGSSFECSLDGRAFTRCGSPIAYTGLARGVHVFSVRARDAAGNADVTPATHRWTIAAAPLRLGVKATVRGRAIRLRAALSRPASLDVRLLNRRGLAVQRWRANRPAGTRASRLRLAPRVAPGRYTLVVRASADGKTTVRRARVSVTAGAPRR